MQKLLMTLALSVSASSLVACKDKDPNAERSEKAAENLAEAREDVNEAAKKVAEERKDVVDENKDVTAARNDLAGAQAVADEARGEFVRAAQVQIDGINQRLKEAEARWGATRKADVDRLRTEVKELEKIRDDSQATQNADWKATKERFDAAVKRFEESFENTRKSVETK
jgi:cell division septum initiation protein DivIVA